MLRLTFDFGDLIISHAEFQIKGPIREVILHNTNYIKQIFRHKNTAP